MNTEFMLSAALILSIIWIVKRERDLILWRRFAADLETKRKIMLAAMLAAGFIFWKHTRKNVNRRKK